MKYWVGFLWCLPNTLLGLLLAIPYGGRDFEWDEGRLLCTASRAIGNPAAQTWGVLIFAVNEHRFTLDAKSRLWRHEGEHVNQGLRWGVLFLLMYGGEWLLRFLLFPGPTVVVYGDMGKRRWVRAYYRLSWERKARAKE